MECRIFKEIVGNNFVGAQVEDVFGVNDLPSNGVDRCQF
jgi:hypothetical protein